MADTSCRMSRASRSHVHVPVRGSEVPGSELMLVLQSGGDVFPVCEVDGGPSCEGIRFSVSGYETLLDMTRTGTCYGEMIESLKIIAAGLKSVDDRFLRVEKCSYDPAAILYDERRRSFKFIYDMDKKANPYFNPCEELVNTYLNMEIDFDSTTLRKLINLRKKVVSAGMTSLSHFMDLISREIEEIDESGRTGTEKEDEPSSFMSLDSLVHNEGCGEKKPELIEEEEPFAGPDVPGNPSCDKVVCEKGGKGMKKAGLLFSSAIPAAIFVAVLLAMYVKLRFGIFDSILAGVAAGASSSILFGMKAKKSAGKIEEEKEVTKERREGDVLHVKRILSEFEKTQVQMSNSNMMLRSLSDETGDFPILKEVTRVGRLRSSSDMYIQSSLIGRNHAEVLIENGEMFIKDLNTLNGTYLNSRRIPANTRIKASIGDKVRFSKFEFEVARIGS